MLRTTPVDLQSRGGASDPKKQIMAEANMLLACRHPNIHFMLGVALDYVDGPVLVMEQAWGSVMAALRSGPLRLEASARITKQVASALEFLHDRKIRHGQVGTRNVLLLESPLSSAAIVAKLANFGTATQLVNDTAALGSDMLNFGVFMYNLFARGYSGAGPGPEQLSQMSLDQLHDSVTVTALGPLLHGIFSRELTTAVEVVARCDRLLQSVEAGVEHAASGSQQGVQRIDHSQGPSALVAARPVPLHQTQQPAHARADIIPQDADVLSVNLVSWHV
jgi:serine/threonine protein kinase